ncbi:tRNA pseudouridine synthase A [Rhodamnia argentea]|uniref:tRNA pseudouridine synthase A n=1 Tax=Rhodamnia argentea TaxID=178133 RepID=A0A8B8P040_9MYRT|nr:tRNA pseudouridine synthase A [Rhodamnia argentea]
MIRGLGFISHEDHSIYNFPSLKEPPMEPSTNLDSPSLDPVTEAPRSPPPQQGPDPKKPKMSSTTTTTSDDEAAAAATRKPRYKRRKVAIFFAYCGVGYQGMQKNPGAKTIEGDLEEALFLSGAVPEADRGNPKRYDWARSARTDKGVSAVGQVVSGRFYIDPPGLVERLNSNLAPQIRIFGYKRATASFNSKKFCDRRRYVYLVPVFALDPSSHRDRESVVASLGSGNELVKCLECSERGRKVVGVMGKRNFELRGCVSEVNGCGEVTVDSNDAKVGSGITSNDCCAVTGIEVKEGIVDSLSNGIDDKSNSDVIDKVDTSSVVDTVVSAAAAPADLDTGSVVKLDGEIAETIVNGEEKPVKGSGFCSGEEEKERFNRILGYYVGSHNFHNFTTRTKAEDPSARRYILSFTANDVVIVEGIEFVKCEVVGQSFMLHQIRKMMGLVVAIMRNCAPETLITNALQKDININVPTAPEVGLYLDECFFTSYNNKWKDSHEELSMKAYEKEAEDFKMKYIYSHIAMTEHKEGVVALWLHSLNYRNYPDLRAGDKQELTENKCSE